VGFWTYFVLTTPKSVNGKMTELGLCDVCLLPLEEDQETLPVPGIGEMHKVCPDGLTPKERLQKLMNEKSLFRSFAFHSGPQIAERVNQLERDLNALIEEGEDAVHVCGIVASLREVLDGTFVAWKDLTDEERVAKGYATAAQVESWKGMEKI
jgi:hypothetical protein